MILIQSCGHWLFTPHVAFQEPVKVHCALVEVGHQSHCNSARDISPCFKLHKTPRPKGFPCAIGMADFGKKHSRFADAPPGLGRGPGGTGPGGTGTGAAAGTVMVLPSNVTAAVREIALPFKVALVPRATVASARRSPLTTADDPRVIAAQIGRAH